jgi:poly(hydroxyalkanoate) granule-associated protein
MSSSSSTAPVSSEAPKRLPRRGLFGTASNLALAGIGIAGVLGDEAQALYRRSVERGQEHVRRAQERLEHARAARRSAKTAGRRSRHAKRRSEELEAILAHLNVPTAADLNALTQQIGELEAKIDQLNKQ